MSLLLAFLPASEEGGGLGGLFDVGQSAYLWTIVVFVLALPAMWKFVFGPIAKALNEREERTRAAARAAEAAQEEARRVREAIQEDLERARAEAAQRVAEARARAEQREREILAAARQQAEVDRARAREEIERSLAAAREQLRGDAVALAVQVAEKVIEREFSPQDQERLLASFQRDVSRR